MYRYFYKMQIQQKCYTTFTVNIYSKYISDLFNIYHMIVINSTQFYPSSNHGDNTNIHICAVDGASGSPPRIMVFDRAIMVNSTIDMAWPPSWHGS